MTNNNGGSYVGPMSLAELIAKHPLAFMTTVSPVGRTSSGVRDSLRAQWNGVERRVDIHAGVRMFLQHWHGELDSGEPEFYASDYSQGPEMADSALRCAAELEETRLVERVMEHIAACTGKSRTQILAHALGIAETDIQRATLFSMV